MMMEERRRRYTTGLIIIIGSMLTALNVIAQNCDVDFPGTASRTFSGSCGGPTVNNLELGINFNLGNGDTFTFDIPVVNITGNLHIDVDGDGKIIIPAGVTVNVGGNVQIHNKNSRCTPSNPCVFEIVVNGNANFNKNFDNDVFTLVWSGSGTVTVDDKFRNSNDACMKCGTGGCPNIEVNPSDCRDDGTACSGGDFCTQINSCSSDTIEPILANCPSDRVVNMSGPTCTQSVNWSPPIVTDNCMVESVNVSHPIGSSFPKGTTVVTYTAKDVAGNTATCSFKVTVVDNIKPILSSCPADKTVTANASCQAVVNWAPPSYSDNCLGTSLSSTASPGDTFSKGTTVVTYTATDASGNTATCSFDVTVVDDAPPVFSGCPANRTVNANASCQAVVSWTPPTVSGNCSGTTISVDKPPGSVFNLGTTRVTYTASTASGETATCFFDVVVLDNLPPVVASIGTIKASVGSDCGAIVTWPLPSAFDCNDFQMQSTHEPGDQFPFGSTDVTYTLTDEVGNATDYSFQVVVENPAPPAISGCPNDITMEADEFGFAVASWLEPTAEVACGQLSLTGSHSPGHRFPTGVTEVIYTASDDLKNQSYCSFKVTVSPPKIIVDIAKVVTPDGNGINDHLKILNIEKYKKNGIVIIDRWGSTIFKANGYDNDKITWDGTNQSGGLAPTGTYFFTMFIQYGEQSVQQTGFIELIR